MREQVIVAARHLPRHLGVAAFIGVEQAVAAEPPAQRDGGGEHEPGERARGHRGGGSSDTVSGTVACRSPSTRISKR